MPRRSYDEIAPDTEPKDTGPAAEGDRGIEPDSATAEKVRSGELSAAQSGSGNIPGSDVQWPPGRVETAAAAFAVQEMDVPEVTPEGRVKQ